MITVYRPPDHFRNHVVRSAERDGAEPEKKQVICEPPPHRRLQNSLHWYDKQHQLPSRIQPRKPEKSAEQIPLGNVNLFAAPVTEHEHCPRGDKRVSDEQNDRRVTRKLEPLVAGAVAKNNSA